jgi:hypothetical protein
MWDVYAWTGLMPGVMAMRNEMWNTPSKRTNEKLGFQTIHGEAEGNPFPEIVPIVSKVQFQNHS